MTELTHWENPHVFGINKRKPHVPLHSYDNLNDLSEYYSRLRDVSMSRRCLCLDGTDTWKFHFCDSPDSVPPEFHSLLFDDSDWDHVRTMHDSIDLGFENLDQYLIPCILCSSQSLGCGK